MSANLRPFAYEIVVVCCWQCGAPVVGAAAGGVVACPGCQSQNTLRARQDYLPPPMSRAPGPQDPALRAQDGRALLPPPSIAFLWEGNALPPHRMNEAWMAWQHARRRAAQGDPSAGEEITMLARELANAAEQSGDRLRARALLESSLEVAPFPRHRAVLLGSLARAAVRAGDGESAFRFWQHFDGASPDLESDSEWRVTTAVVATVRGDYATVLQAIGATFEQLAIQDALDPQAAIFRANALERSGQLALASAQLEQMFAMGGPAVRALFERMTQLYAPLGLCPSSLSATVAKREAAGASSAGLGKIGLGAVLIIAPLLPALIGGGTALSALTSGGGLPEGDELMPVLMPLGMSVIFFFSFGLWGIRSIRAGLRERRAFTRGVRTTARVLSARPTGTSVNDIPEMAIELEVALSPPVRSVLRRLVHPGELHAIAPGAVLHVRIDPTDPSTATLDA